MPNPMVEQAICTSSSLAAAHVKQKQGLHGADRNSNGSALARRQMMYWRIVLACSL